MPNSETEVGIPLNAAITALIITKNEELSIRECVLAAHSLCDQVVVVDSNSVDKTAAIATSLGAEVINFKWDGTYPKKKQWAMQLGVVKNDWVLLLDADEIVTPSLAREASDAISRAPQEGITGFNIALTYHFSGRALRHGHTVYKRSLVNRRFAQFPEVGDLEMPGIAEVEGHYQPRCTGAVKNLHARLTHKDPDPISTWVDRHNRYSDWEAAIAQSPNLRLAIRSSRTRNGAIFDATPFKPLTFFLYSFLAKGGFLDGRAGFDYAFALSWYYWLVSVKAAELKRARA